MSPSFVLGYLCLVVFGQSKPIIIEDDTDFLDTIKGFADDVKNGIKDAKVAGIDGMEYGFKILKKNLLKWQELDDLAKQTQEQADAKIAELVHTIALIETEKIEVTRNTVDTYLTAKGKLRDARQKLKQLAIKTIRVMKEFEVYMDSWKPESKQKKNIVAYFEKQLSIVNKLLKESKKTIDEVQLVYKEVTDDMDKVEHQLRTIRLKIKEQKGKEYKDKKGEFDRWATDLRASANMAAIKSTIGCMFVDAFGLLGICSAINNAVVSSRLASMETEIANLKADLDRLEIVFKNAEVSSNTMIKATNRMQKYVTEETNLMIVWENAVDSLDGEMEDAYDFLSAKLPLMRQVFETAVLELRQAAEEYSKRPDFITDLDKMFLEL